MKIRLRGDTHEIFANALFNFNEFNKKNKNKNVDPISMEICKDICLNITPKHGIRDLTILLSMPKLSHVVICNM